MERFETEMTERVGRALDRLPSIGGVMLLYGPHGVGKTTAVEMAMPDRQQVRRVLVAPPGERSGLRGFYADIAAELGLTVANNHSHSEAARQIASFVRQHDLLLVLDNAEVMRRGQLDCVRHLADQVPALVLVGSTALLTRVQGHEAMLARMRVPLEATPVSLAELVGHLGVEFSEAWLAATHEASGGLWSGIWTLVNWARLRGDTRDAGADEARQAAATFLLRAA